VFYFIIQLASLSKCRSSFYCYWLCENKTHLL